MYRISFSLAVVAVVIAVYWMKKTREHELYRGQRFIAGMLLMASVIVAVFDLLLMVLV